MLRRYPVALRYVDGFVEAHVYTASTLREAKEIAVMVGETDRGHDVAAVAGGFRIHELLADVNTVAVALARVKAQVKA